MINYFASLFRSAERRRLLSDLMTFDDHLLNDIGLTRGDIAELRAKRNFGMTRSHA